MFTSPSQFVNLVLSLHPVCSVPLGFACFSFTCEGVPCPPNRLLLATSSPNVIFVYPSPCTASAFTTTINVQNFCCPPTICSLRPRCPLSPRIVFKDTPCCFRTLWPVFSAVTPGLRGHIRHLTQQDIGDLLFSISREYARRAMAPRSGSEDGLSPTWRD